MHSSDHSDGMTGLIVLDESGDLGLNGTKEFTLAALIIFRPRHLKSAYKLVQNKGAESKWHNTEHQFKEKVLKTMDNCQFDYVYATINKNHPLWHKKTFGNELYEIMVRQVVSDALSVAPCKDMRVYLDKNRFITNEKFKKIVSEECNQYNINLVDAGLRNSKDTPCIQLVDFIVGAIHSYCEYGDKT